ncbi:M10 family metallopeptidase [Tropicimonas isoalkanivorans]|uniref:Serralysin n=1 Tax=Tropicimonas isoalkanivorans TaxID=441112 RepID=A0A1I1KZ17_9RHOB|nr:M10 family metallopeptidase [Tropicimonas isoalkanivorans]SFC65532.1 serralysin [Tropicimonas isoalkanivorans]
MSQFHSRFDLVAGAWQQAGWRARFDLLSDHTDSATVASGTTGAFLPTYSIGKIADVLLHGTWNTHGGDTWKFDLNLDRTPRKALTVDYSGLNDAGEWFAKKALAAWTAATGIRFESVSSGSGAQIEIDDERSGATTSKWAWSTGEIDSASINISKDWIKGDEYTYDAYSLRTYIHEIGHALGLGHPADYGSTLNDGDNFGTDATFANDSWQTTVMSYYSQRENTATDATHAYVLTPQMADVLAIQQLYGTTDSLRLGKTTYGVGSTAGDFYDVLEKNWKTMAFTIVDDGGNDTIDFSNTGRDQVVDLSPGAFSSVGARVGNMGIAVGTIIENFKSGSGDDLIWGNRVSNSLTGGGGTDRINGAGGSDKLLGGNGQDTLRGQAGNDRLVGGADADALLGGGGRDVLLGGGGRDTLKGQNGADVLVGGAGRDILIGGAGSDTFVFDRGAGRDVIRDWSDGEDRVDLKDWHLSSFREAMSLATPVNDGIALGFGDGDTLTIRGLSLETFSPGDVLLDA